MDIQSAHCLKYFLNLCSLLCRRQIDRKEIFIFLILKRIDIEECVWVMTPGERKRHVGIVVPAAFFFPPLASGVGITNPDCLSESHIKL